MLSSKYIIFFLLFLLLIVLNCIKDFSPSIQNTNPTLSISPSQGVIGTKVKIFGLPFDLPASHNIITFSNVGDFIRADSGSIDTIFAYVPFCAQSGKIEFQNSKGIYFIDDFTVIENCQNEVKVSWSDFNYPITEEMSTLTVFPGVIKNWSVETVQDTIKITGQYFPGDFSVTQRLILLNKGESQLPEFLSGYAMYYPDYPDSTIFNMDKGLIKIQDWDLNGRISGRVLSTPWNYNDYIFGYDFKK